MRIVTMVLLCAVAASADPKDALAGDWWGTMAERRLTLAADGTLTEFRPTDAAERAGTWKVDGDKVTLQFDGRKAADVFTFAIDQDELSLTDESGRSTRLKKEARADREKRMTDMLVSAIEKQRESDEEPDQFKRQQEADEARATEKRAESLVRSLVGADSEKQKAYTDGLLKARDASLVDAPPSAGTEEAVEVKPREKEAAGDKRKCINQLKQIGVYMALFEAKFRRYPKTMKEMKRPDMMTNESLSHCPCDGASGPEFGYCPPAKGDETSADAICAYDLRPHADGTRNVLRFQGRVDSVSEEDFRKELKDAGGRLSLAPGRSKDVSAQSAVKDGKVVVTVRARIVDLKQETVDGKPRVRARVSVRALLSGSDEKPVDSGVRVIAAEPAAGGLDVEVSVVLPTSDPDRVALVTLLVEDRVAGDEAGETDIDGKNVRATR